MPADEKINDAYAQTGSNDEPKVPVKSPSPNSVAKVKDTKLLSRLKNAGLDPQKLLDVALNTGERRKTAKLRHRMIVLGFTLFVAVPSALFAIYMFFFASNQYHSTTAFAVRSSNSSAATEVLGMMLNSNSESTASNSYIVTDYLQSQAAVQDLEKTLNLQEIYNRPGADPLFRMGKDLPIEEQVGYWNKMVDISFDSTSGVLYIEVRAFTAEDAVTIGQAILKRVEALVNNLSEVSRRQSVRYAEETLARAEARLKAIRKQMVSYRDLAQEVSPEDGARISMQMIGQLEQRAAAKEAEKTTLLSYLNEDSPRVRLLTEEISAIRAQIETERKQVGGGRRNVSGSSTSDDHITNRLSERIADFSDLKLEEEFANKFYVTAMAGLESARQEAEQKHMYLAKFIDPTLSQDAQYPHRFMYSLACFLLLGGIWSVCVLLYYNVRDRT